MFFFTAYAQKEITTTEVLLGAKNIEQVKFDSIQLAFLKDYNHDLPLVNNVEFRTETRDLLFSRQEYSIRVKPNSLRAVLAKKKIYTSKINEVEMQGRIYFNEELEDRYNLLIDYLFNEKLTEAYQLRKIQLQDKLSVLEQSIYEEYFDVRDLVEVEEDLFKTEVILNNLDEVKNYQNAILQLMVSEQEGDVALKNSDLITPDQILAITIDEKTLLDNLEIQIRQSNLETIAGEMSLDVAKSKKILDFVQAKYEDKNSNLFDESFSIGVGINLPFFGNTREKRSEYYFDKLRAESEILALKSAQTKEVSSAKEEFRRTALKYTTYKDQAANSSVTSLLNTYKKMEGVSPIILLKLKISEHNRKIDILKLERVLYEKYIKLLASKNVLFQVPFVNYLSADSVFLE